MPRRRSRVPYPGMSALAERIKPLLPAFKKDDLEILIDLVVLVAYSDGEVDGAELTALGEAFEAILHSPLSPLVVKTLIGSSVDEIKAAGADAFASQLGKELREHGKGIDGVRLGFAIARASDGLGRDERERLLLVSEAAGLSAAEFAEIESNPG